MMDSRTGELTPLDMREFTKQLKEGPPAGKVLLQGTEDDVRRVASAVSERYDAEKAKAKRKAQRQARKRNR